MFKLIATIVMLINGQPEGDPMKLAANHLFDDRAECMAFADSEMGAAALAKLDEAVTAAQKPGVTHAPITTECVPNVKSLDI